MKFKKQKFKKDEVSQKGFTPTPNKPLLFRRAVNIKGSVIKILNLGDKKKRSASKHEDGLLWCRGFTLIESLVGITILLLAITAVLTLVTRNIAISASARDQVAATYLAQEAIEIIRNTRDNNTFAGVPWLTGLGTCLGVGLVCKVDTTKISAPATECTLGGTGVEKCSYLKLDSDNIYQYLNGDDTIYKRSVNLISVSAEEVIISTTVQWSSVGRKRTFVLVEHIFDWE